MYPGNMAIKKVMEQHGIKSDKELQAVGIVPKRRGGRPTDPPVHRDVPEWLLESAPPTDAATNPPDDAPECAQPPPPAQPPQEPPPPPVQPPQPSVQPSPPPSTTDSDWSEDEDDILER